jgi:PGF-CTERM protein
MDPSSSTSRRQFLTAATATAVAVPAVTAAGGSREPAQQTTIRLTSDLDGWQGVAPDRIAGESNPTLFLTAGEEYEIVWENADGVGHNLVLYDESDEAVERTETVGEEGETRSVTFTATEDLAGYRCGIHPTSMQGDIRFGEATTATTAAERTTETTDEYGGDDDSGPGGDGTDEATVTETTTLTTEDSGGGAADSGGQPGFGVLAAVVGLVSALGLRRYRRR